MARGGRLLVVFFGVLATCSWIASSLSTQHSKRRKGPDERYRKNTDLYTQLGQSKPTLARSPVLTAKPKVLAPAGGWPQLRAAALAGADCVYFGCSGGLNARARAANFAASELGEVVRFLHARGMEGYLCMNVLVFDDEIDQAMEIAREAAKCGVDALIVQDLGLAHLLREVAPGLPVHASTQMSITDANGALFVARELGCETVVVGRELSVEDISAVSSRLSLEASGVRGDDAGAMPTRVEAFVHGALCVSYSGQCFSSEAWGGRSANRGQCAQACRMPYALIVDGEIRKLIDDASYLLSPQDLMGLDRVSDMIAAGVDTFKIEGRLKGPEYVYLTTSAYRARVDEAWAKLTGEAAPPASSAPRWVPSREDLAQVFARGQDHQFDGLTEGFLDGPQHQVVVRGRAPKHRGRLVGRVVRVNIRGRSGGRGGASGDVEVVVDLGDTGCEVRRGDGVVFDQGRPESEELGGPVFGVRDPRTGREVDLGDTDAGLVSLVFGRDVGRRIADLGPKALSQALVWKTKDPRLEAQVAQSLATVVPAASANVPVEAQLPVLEEGRRRAVDARVTVRLGETLRVELRDEDGNVGTAETASTAATAAKRPLSTDVIASALGELGGSPFHLAASRVVVDLDPAADLFVALSEIKAARREALRALGTAWLARIEERDAERSRGLLSSAETQDFLLHWRATLPTQLPLGAGHPQETEPSPTTPTPRPYSISVLCRSPAQVRAVADAVSRRGSALGEAVSEVVVDFLEAKGIPRALEVVREAGLHAVVAAPRIVKPAEEGLWRWLLYDLQPDGILVRSTGLLQQLLQSGSSQEDSAAEGHCSSGKGENAITAGDLPVAKPAAATAEGPVSTPRIHGDFSLNAANALTASLLLSSGLASLAPTHDLNADQLVELAESLGSSWEAERTQGEPAPDGQLECILHQKLPIFHTEHCVFCRFLSSGNSYKDCGHPCETQSVHLRGTDGEDNLVLADMGCRNTVFNAKAQSAAEYLPPLISAGYRRFRIELVDEPPEVVEPLLSGYAEVLEAAWHAADVEDSQGHGPLASNHDDDDDDHHQQQQQQHQDLDFYRVLSRLFDFLETLPDSNGRAHGVTDGSLRPVSERAWSSLRPTARR
uniref:Peptidase U32 collagenase domain-containing protein n=1 Tax=Rhizochromulina marina TaxID=1034831 RepID=A0A7S2WUD7_9STRA|mmetsp:Transcript_3830/g.11198  ORF Transcript_3830/g.11198 Transcript_3830/m.11198 type:complete len:1119 (+) Transcript_3830:32-3388(+)